ncbi:MAG TPA: hypothetical protein VKU00_30585, partial [Chthonomonadaceae bacterium]|nr:hypothetical protein [Chthonomonadaceae bacterium]
MSASDTSKGALSPSASEINTSLASQQFTILYFDHTASMSGGEIALLHLLQALDRARYVPLVVLGIDGPLAQRL